MKDKDIINQLMTGNHLEPNELDRAFELLHGLKTNWESRRRVIKVKFHSEDSGFCIKFYKGVDDKKMYGLLEEFKDVSVWHTVTTDGEPIARVRRSVKMKVVE